MTNEVMLRDIRSQGDALANGLVSLRSQLSQAKLPANVERIVITGSGDSFIAAVAVQALFENHVDVPVHAIPSLDASRYLLPTPRDLVVVVSVSGEVARTIEVAARARAAGAATIAVTAAIGSTLGTVAGQAIAIPMPIDRSIPHCRDYSVTLLALVCLLEWVAAVHLPQLDVVPLLIHDVVERTFDALGHVLAHSGRTWFLGAGPDRATAMFGALKYWEAAGMEAWWDDLEEFGHGSQLMARPGDRAVLIASGGGSDRAVEMLPGFERMGLDILLVGGRSMSGHGHQHLATTDDLDYRWHPFAACAPLQVLTYLEAQARELDVSVPLHGRSYGPAFEEVHVDWTKRSAVVTDGVG